MKASSSPDSDTEDVSIGRSETAMWMRIVSSWVCMLLYIWSLLAPVIMPDRYVRSVSARWRFLFWLTFDGPQVL